MTEETYRAIKAACLLCVSLAAVFSSAALSRSIVSLIAVLTRDSGRVAQNAENASNSLQIALSHIQAIETDTQRTEAELAGLLNQTRHSLLTAVETKELVDKASKVMEDADTATVRLGTAAESLSQIGPATAVTVAEIGEETKATLETSQALMKAATEDLDQPGLKEIVEHTDETSANLAATTADVRKIADEWAAPVKGFWKRTKAVLFEIAGPAASVATAIK